LFITLIAGILGLVIWTVSRPRLDIPWQWDVLISTRPEGRRQRSPLSDLPAGHRAAVLIVVCCGAVALASSIPALRYGLPASPTESCQYRLVNKAVETCVLRPDYEHAELAQQRLMAGFYLIFFAVVGGAGLGELRRRSDRQDGSGPTPDIDPGPDVYTILRDRPTGEPHVDA
jgi:hypothetical protein